MKKLYKATFDCEIYFECGDKLDKHSEHRFWDVVSKDFHVGEFNNFSCKEIKSLKDVSDEHLDVVFYGENENELTVEEFIQKNLIETQSEVSAAIKVLERYGIKCLR